MSKTLSFKTELDRLSNHPDLCGSVKIECHDLAERDTSGIFYASTPSNSHRSLEFYVASVLHRICLELCLEPVDLQSTEFSEALRKEWRSPIELLGIGETDEALERNEEKFEPVAYFSQFMPTDRGVIAKNEHKFAVCYWYTTA